MRCGRWLVAALLCVSCGLAIAQADDLELEFKKPDPAETLRLQTVMNDPVPQGLSRNELVQLYWEKELAARILGNVPRYVEILREAIAAVGVPGMKRNLGQMLIKMGQFDEGNSLMKQAATEGSPVEAAFSSATMVCDLYVQNRDAEARKLAQEVDARINGLLRRVKEQGGLTHLWRAASRRDICLSKVEDRVGHTAQAIEFARSGEQYARMALQQIASQSLAAWRNGVLIDVSGAIARKMEANLAVDRLQEAEKVLAEYVRFSREYQLPTGKLSDLYEHAAHLRFAQREFVQAERYLRKSDGVLASMGQGPLGVSRLNDTRDIVQALIGQRKWKAALAELERLDGLAGEAAESAARRRIQMPMLRGMVYLHTGKADEAVALLEQATQRSQEQFGPNHFYTAQARGLWGAALWRSGAAEARGKALPVLKTAVKDFMAPASADFQEGIGIRKEVREWVFSAYLDAAASSSVQDALDAMGPADWARGGVVKDALNDAAVRSSANTPALADVVRREQDAKNEIAGLRRFLSGEIGSSETPLPQVAAQMRERIAELEAERSKLQAEVKSKFPDYDRLVHPQAPTVRDIAQQLAPNQALVLLLPGAEGVYAWAVSRDQPAVFVKSPMTETQVKQLVGKLRSQLDFGSNANAGSQFDGAAAFALYDALLSPLNSVLSGKTSWVVATSGALSQLPFGLLHTRAGGGFDAQAPWLIRQTSIAQVPSLSSWLAIKSLGRARSASQAFVGWADPVFDLQLAEAPATPATGTRRVTLTRAAAFAEGDAPDAIAAANATAIKYASIPTLPDTRDELLSIAAALKADPGQDLLLGKSATRESVLAASRSGKLVNKRVVAFATHGLMAGDLPNLTQPALALAATGREEKEPLSALLTLEDVLTLKLNADWVVLSACNSAAEDGRGDEVMSGLARGFSMPEAARCWSHTGLWKVSRPNT